MTVSRQIAALRRMLEVSGRDKICNADIRERLEFKETLVQKVYQRQHTWLGNVWQMNNERIAEKAVEGKGEGKRHVDKQKISWLPNTLKDVD